MVQLLLDVIDGSVRHAEKHEPLMMRDVIKYIQAHLGEEFRLEELARQAGYSLSRFKVRFKEETGMSPRHYIVLKKIEAAQQRLLAGSEPISEIAGDLGFPTSQYFATVFSRFTGMTPTRYREEAARPHVPSRRREDRQG